MVLCLHVIEMDGNDMELILFDPAYYSKEFGVDKEIRKFLDDISNYFFQKSYSKTITIIRISSPIVPKKVVDDGGWPNTIKCWPSSHDASVFNRIKYELYVHANLEVRKSLLVKNILISMKLLEKKAKLDYLAFEKDMLDFCRKNNISIDTSDINDIVKASKPKKPKRNKNELYWSIKISDSKQEYDDRQDGYEIIDDYFSMLEMENTKFIKLIPSRPLNDISYLKAILDKKKECLIIEAYAADSKLYIKDDLELGEGLDVFVDFYQDHKIDLSKWSNKN